MRYRAPHTAVRSAANPRGLTSPMVQRIASMEILLDRRVKGRCRPVHRAPLVLVRLAAAQEVALERAVVARPVERTRDQDPPRRRPGEIGIEARQVEQ